MIELRQRIGSIGYEIREHGATFILTYQGKPFAELGPLSKTTIQRDGKIIGPKPLTFRMREGAARG